MESIVETRTAPALPPRPAPPTAEAAIGIEEQRARDIVEEDKEPGGQQLQPLPPAPEPVAPQQQQEALQPACAAGELDSPEFGAGQLTRLRLADRPGGAKQKFDVLTSAESGFTCLFVRSLKKAIYGEVWDALEVEIVEVNGEAQYYNVVRDEDGLERRFAVKRMPWDKINHYRRHIKEDPLHEISALSMMSDPGHPNVLRKVEALDDGKTIYLITPFISGGELFDWIADDGAAPVHIVRTMFRQIVDGMRYMHNKGVCHADMSLENCLVDAARSEAFIIDFGMCLVMPRDEEGRRYICKKDKRKAKPSYCSPETFKERDYDGVKVDVFAAGAMLYMMLTGFPPFKSATRIDPDFRTLVWRRDVEGLLDRYNIPRLDPEASDLIRSMMAYMAEDRPLPEQVLAHPWMTVPPDGH